MEQSSGVAEWLLTAPRTLHQQPFWEGLPQEAAALHAHLEPTIPAGAGAMVVEVGGEGGKTWWEGGGTGIGKLRLYLVVMAHTGSCVPTPFFSVL